MAYVKQVFCNSDYPVGYQSINQLIDNLDASFDGMDAEHVSADIPLNPGGTDIGRHDSKNVVLDVLQVYGSRFSVSLFGNMVEVESSGNYAGPVTRISAGVYLVEVLGAPTYWGEAVASVTSSTPIPHIDCRSVYPTSPAATPGIVVTCYELGTGSFVATDFDFTLTICGER